MLICKVKIEREQHMNEFYSNNDTLNESITQLNLNKTHNTTSSSKRQHSIDELLNEENINKSFNIEARQQQQAAKATLDNMNYEDENDIVLNNFQVDNLRQLIRVIQNCLLNFPFLGFDCLCKLIIK